MLNQNEIEFIEKHLNEDVTKLALYKNNFPNVKDVPKLLFQIKARQKLADKLPTWTKHPKIFFPPQLSLEQSSSEKTALFKAKLIKGKIIDLTGGMGLDSWAFAKETGNEVTYIEINETLAQITTYNHNMLGLEQIKHFHADGMEFIVEHPNSYDWIYMDPARRATSGQKVFLLKDCTPDATRILPYIQKNTKLLIKVSPMLDIDLCIKELHGVDEVHIVCIQNEIKELLFIKTTEANFTPYINIWDLHEGEKLIGRFSKKVEMEASIAHSQVLNYLYEPHAGILKGGFFKSIVGDGLFKISNNTHLYTSNDLITNFPGRTFKVISTGKVDEKWVKLYIKDAKASITCRNFPLKPEEIRKKLKLSEGGDVTLLAYRNKDNQPEISICQKT